MTTALRIRLGLIPAEQPAASSTVEATAAVVTYTDVAPSYASEAEARYHTANITR